jgi:NAD(P)-dependent dehydrogenase (short-subunit alcohol dehydrogenase family)
MPTVLVTGAARGLGLEFVRQYAAAGWRVLAAVRTPANAAELAAVAGDAAGRVTVHRVDVADSASVAALATELRDVKIDVLLNNAGTMGAQSFAKAGPTVQRFGHSDYDDWEQMFRVNVLGPMRMAEAFVGHVEASERRVIATLTSIVGSIAGNNFGGMYAYRSTKAGANAIMKSMALDLARRGIVAVPIHPGWARTDMGGPNAPVDPKDSVAGVIRVIDGLTKEQAGRFLQYDGTELPW